MHVLVRRIRSVLFAELFESIRSIDDVQDTIWIDQKPQHQGSGFDPSQRGFDPSQPEARNAPRNKLWRRFSIYRYRTYPGVVSEPAGSPVPQISILAVQPCDLISEPLPS